MNVEVIYVVHDSNGNVLHPVMPGCGFKTRDEAKSFKAVLVKIAHPWKCDAKVSVFKKRV